MVKTGTLSAANVQAQQLLLPFPEYTGVSEANADVFNSSYHSLQMKVEKRFSQGWKRAGELHLLEAYRQCLGQLTELAGFRRRG